MRLLVGPSDFCNGAVFEGREKKQAISVFRALSSSGSLMVPRERRAALLSIESRAPTFRMFGWSLTLERYLLRPTSAPPKTDLGPPVTELLRFKS